MRNEFIARERQLVEVKRSLTESEARNAAESRELAVMLSECHALPRVIPPSPRSPASVAPPTPPISPPVPSVTLEEHQRLLRAAISPLESTINQLKVQYENVTKDRESLAREVSRLSGLVDNMQDEASDAVGQLPLVGPGSASSHPEIGAADVAQDVIHRLVSMGVFVTHDEDGRRGPARVEPGGEGSVTDSAESGAAEETHVGAAAAVPTDGGGTGKDRKWKRPSAVHVPKFPTVTQIPQWEKAVARALVAAPIYDDKAEVKWFKRTSRKGVTFADLADIGEERYHALDALFVSGTN